MLNKTQPPASSCLFSSGAEESSPRVEAHMDGLPCPGLVRAPSCSWGSFLVELS